VKTLYDLAITEGKDGQVLVHKADCPAARTEAALGRPVATFFGCERMPPEDLPRHSCLTGEDDDAR
jgi:hypothetical protein